MTCVLYQQRASWNTEGANTNSCLSVALAKKVVTGATEQTKPKFLYGHPIALQPIGDQRRDEKVNQGYTWQKLRCSKLRDSVPAVHKNSSQFVLAALIDLTATSFHTKQIHTSKYSVGEFR